MNSNQDNRELLQNGSQLYLRRYDSPQLFGSTDSYHYKTDSELELFIIQSVDGRGSSAICYDAIKISKDGSEKRGKLKEFYPVDLDISGFEMHLERADSVNDENRNQLFSKYGTLENFELLKRVYENSYAILESARNYNSFDAKDLNEYIPDYSFYVGVPSQPKEDDYDKKSFLRNVSFYVWSENQAGIKEFDKYLESLCNKIKNENIDNGRIENKINEVSFILNCILELAKCIDVLHRFGLYHLDLTPKNFGIGLYNNSVDKDNATVMLYDINSLLSDRVKKQLVLSSGTEYFRSPEVIHNRIEDCGIQSDIYSLGTILFYALNIRENSGNYYNTYFCDGMDECSKEAYDNIAIDLYNSELIQSSDDTKQNLLFEGIVSILKKSLNRFYDDNNNYDTVGDFVSELKKVISETKFESWKINVESNYGLHADAVIEDNESYYDRKIGASGAIQKLLFNNPLYNYCNKKNVDEPNCKVLVIGCGTYASEFIDYALELSQVKGCCLDITVATKDKDVKKGTYLSIRKSIPDFVKVDGQPAKLVDSTPYGYLNFKELEFKKDIEYNETILEQSLKDQYSYVFIALNNEVLNRNVAEACKRFFSDDSIISFIQFKNNKRKRFPGPLKPVYVDESLRDLPEYDILKQMALNIHLCWYKDYINNLNDAETDFKKKYNFNSSMEHALSIIYKLHSVGIELDFNNLEESAKLIYKIINSDKKVFRELVYYEHRRWIIEKITESWQPMTDISTLKTKTRDDKKKLHPCIVPSNESFALNNPKWKNNNCAHWDDVLSETELSELDPLDALSIRFHQHWKKIINIIKSQKNENIIDKKLNSLQEKSANDQKLSAICDSLIIAVHQMIYQDSNNTEIVAKYKHLFNQLKRQAKHEKLADVVADLDDLAKEMTPVVEYRSFTDWKKKDDVLIRKLPFILTYNTKIHLCIPFYFERRNEQNTTQLFSNVASVLMVNPQMVTYVVDGDKAVSDEQGLLDSLQYAVNIIEKHGLQTSINVKLLRDDRFNIPAGLKNSIYEINRIKNVDVLPYKQWLQSKALHQFLMQKSSKDFTAIEVNETSISGCLQSANYELANSPSSDELSMDKPIIPNYTFDSITQKFIVTDGCYFLRYIENNPILFTDDLYLSMGKSANESKPEIISSYRCMWKLYTGKHEKLTKHNRGECSSTYKKLCKSVAKHFEDASVIAEFHFKEGERDSVAGNNTFILPEFCYPFLNEFLNIMKNSPYDFFQDFEWEWISSDTVSLRLFSPSESMKDAFTKLIFDPIKISQQSLLNIIRISDGFKIIYSPLIVSKMSLPRECTTLCLEMLKIIEEEGFIRSLNSTELSGGEIEVSFSFVSEQIVKLLSNEGYVFEINAYYDALESGFFDDVSTGVEIVWNEQGVNNEIDVVLTRGFQTITIECKAKQTIEQDTYYKLYPLSRTFGINTIPVLLVDLNNRPLTPINKMEVQRGKELGITTICSSDNLSLALKKLFDDRVSSQRSKNKIV